MSQDQHFQELLIFLIVGSLLIIGVIWGSEKLLSILEKLLKKRSKFNQKQTRNSLSAQYLKKDRMEK